MDYRPKEDLATLVAMVDNLVPYIYEEPLYGTISPSMPRLTIGGILLRFHSLESVKDRLTEKEKGMLCDSRQRYEIVKSEWQVHYGMKLSQELNTRLRDLNEYLDDCLTEETYGIGSYLPEAKRRTIVHFLEREAIDRNLWTENMGTMLTLADAKIESLLDYGKDRFVFGKGLEGAYEKSAFPWLYHYPKERR